MAVGNKKKRNSPKLNIKVKRSKFYTMDKTKKEEKISQENEECDLAEDLKLSSNSESSPAKSIEENTQKDINIESDTHSITQKRQQRLNMEQVSLPDTLLFATKSFVLGVALGLSGVIVKPLTGAQQEGVEGFFRGIGKGLLGLITKPSGGVLDMVSMAFDGIRRAAELGENVVVRLRLPRFINPTVGLRPYSPYDATGYRLLQHISKGHYAQTDIYWTHATLSKDDQSNVCLITDKHLFLLEKCRFWGAWDIEWVVSIDDIMTVPFISKRKLVVKVKQDETIISFVGDERYVESKDTQVLEWLKNKIEKVLLFNVKEKPCLVDV